MISVTILIKNGERRLKDVLGSLAQFDEVILYDTGSTDNTFEIAGQFPNTKVFRNNFNGFGKSHNAAAALATHDWILSIDADEVLSSNLANEIVSLRLNPECVYALPFHNYFNGKWIRWCGWHPEKHIRLYHRKKTCFSEAMVHEGVEKGRLKEVMLKHPVYHYSYESVSDFLKKMEQYSNLFAEQYKHKRRSSPLIAFSHGAFAFFKSYFLKMGFLGGYEGFLISSYMSQTAFYKYLKLYQANRNNASCDHVP